MRLAKGKGRGLFVSKNLNKGDLLIVEKAIAEAEQDKEISNYNAT